MFEFRFRSHLDLEKLWHVEHDGEKSHGEDVDEGPRHRVELGDKLPIAMRFAHGYVSERERARGGSVKRWMATEW